MSHGFKNAMIGLLAVASVYFYVLNELHADLVDEAFDLCFLEPPVEQAIAVAAPDPQI